jgi:hypothetical protein
MKKNLLLLSILTLVLVSCDKDDDDGDCATTVATVSGTYKITAMKYKQTPSSAEVDFFATLDNCEKDDLTILNANGTFSIQDAGTICSPTTSYSSTWSLSGNTITIDGETGTIESFDCNLLNVSASGLFVAGDKMTVTYDKQ